MTESMAAMAVLAEAAFSPPAEPVRTAGVICLVLVMLAGAVTAVRVVRGPTLADRVVGLDLLGTLVAAGVLGYGLLTGQPLLVWVALVLALLLFLGTVAFSYALLHGTGQ